MNNDIFSIIKEELKLSIAHKGYLDWTTGVIRININGDDYRNLDSLYNYIQNDFYETLAHELFHSIQICTCGYLYKYVYTYSKDFWNNNIFKFDGSNNLKYNKQIVENIKSEIKVILEIHPTSNLSVRDIIESQAVLVHNIILNPKINQKKYKKKVLSFKDTEYGKAYFYLYEYIGDKAFYALSGTSYISLLYSNPINVFCYIAENLSKYKSTISFDTIGSILNEIVSSYSNENNKFLGSPINFFKNNKVIHHPFYEQSIKKVYSNYTIEKISEMHMNPFKIDLKYQVDNIRPLLLNTMDIIIPNGFSSKYFGNDKDLLEKALILYTYASQKLLSIENNG